MIPANPAPPVARDAWRDVALDLAIATFCILPLLLTAHIPYEDLPNHLARQFIIAGLPTDPHYGQYYAVHWQWTPNLAIDIFTLFVGKIVSIDMSVRLFCIATMLMIFAGVRSINRFVSGGTSRLYRFVPVLCYGGPVQFGFLNYCFGIGVALVLTGLYLRNRRLALPLLFAVFAPMALLLLLCHIAAFGLFSAAVVGIECTRAWQDQRTPGRQLAALTVSGMRSACILLPPLLPFVLFGSRENLDVPPTYSLFSKVESLVAITSYNAPWLDLSVLAVTLLALAVGLLTRTVRLTAVGLATLIVMGVIWLVSPRHLLGGGYLDYRLPWADALFCLAFLIPALPRPRLAPALALVMTLAAVVRISGLSLIWMREEPIIAEIDNVLSTLPRGTKLFAFAGHAPRTSTGRSPSFSHVSAYAVARRQAYWPGMFAGITGQILYNTPGYTHKFDQIPAKLDSIPDGFEYFLVLGPQYVEIAPGLPLQCLRSTPTFQLYRIEQGDPPPAPQPCK